MTDIATVGVRVDSRGAKKGSAEVNSSVKSMSGSFRNLKAIIATVGLSLFFLKTVRDAKVFQQSIAELSAITGAVGKDLEFLSDKAREFGATTTLTASQAAEAFKLIASAKPDLLESGEALAKVTKAAITLAEAASSTLPQAAKILGSTLNQFSADAEEAGRFMNVLAAGAKFGASEIPDTAEAMKLAGTVAASMGISFEQANASIQSLAKISIKGGEAGASLRNVFLRLESSADKNLRPSIVGLDTALNNLAAENLSSAEMTKLFGLRAIITANQLLKERKELIVLTEKLTDTVTAYEQAATAVDTLEGDTKALNSAIESFSITLGEKSNPGLRDMTQLLTLAVRQFDALASSGGSSSRIMEGFEMALATVLKIGNSVVIAFADMGDMIGAFVASAEALASLDIRRFKEIRAARNATLKENEATMKELNDGIDNRKQKFAELKEAQAQAIVDEQEWSKAVRELNEEVGRSESMLKAQMTLKFEAMKSGQKILESMASPQEKFNEKIRKADEILRLGGFSQAEYTRVIETYRKALESATEGAELFTDAERNRLTRSVEQLDQSLLTEEERLIMSYQRRGQMLEDAWLNDLITDEKNMELQKQLREQHENDLVSLGKKGSISQEQFAELSGKKKFETISGFLENETSALAVHNKEAFELNKAAATANAIISTYQGAAAALKEGPLGLLKAAFIVAKGLALVNQIQSAQFGSATSAPSVGGGSAIPTTNVDQPQGVGAQQQGSTVQIIIEGNVLGNEEFVTDILAPILEEKISTNDLVIIQPGSRQAAELG